MYTWEIGDNWLSTAEAADLAAFYTELYDPKVRKISLLARDWASEVSQVPAIHLASATRVRPAVMGRFLWAQVMFNAGFSYPQISRAQMRLNHDYVMHMLHHRKVGNDLLPYRKIAMGFGTGLGAKRLKYIDDGESPSVDPLNKREGRANDLQKRIRLNRIAALERDLQFSKDYAAVVVDEGPDHFPGLVKPRDDDMDDLHNLLVKEASGG